MRQPDLWWDPFGVEDVEFEWECLCDELTELISKIYPGGRLHATVSNFGWDNRSGYQDFIAHNGREFLRKILPDTECSFKIWVDELSKTITIDNAHHDKPTGGEIYKITPQEANNE